MNKNYYILPFRFKRFKNLRLMVNEAGDYHFISIDDFNRFINYGLNAKEELYLDLKSKNFIADKDLSQAIEMTATRYRSKKKYLNDFTALHMIVITYRCNHVCDYCQVRSEDITKYDMDMKPEIARNIVDIIFCSPSPSIKIEFQGGEPLLNWECIIQTVEYAKKLNKKYKKNLEFVICTNLTLITEKKLKYISKNNILISTSLDGPKEIHDNHRKMRSGKSSYENFLEKLQLTKSLIGNTNISALMTTTKNSIYNIEKIVDEYRNLGFNSIFLRPINPFGLAVENKQKLQYPISEFINMYKEGLKYILELNKKGYFFVEHFTSLLLSRILTPFSTGFVDLQSPSGAGISGVIYDYNGDVYPSDEARMLARMGDQHFYMGNVISNNYFEIFAGEVIYNIVNKSCLDIYPDCCYCAYMPYCGSDPVKNYLEFGDEIPKANFSSFCSITKGIFDILFSYLYDEDCDVLDIFWSWITKRNFREIKHEENFRYSI